MQLNKKVDEITRICDDKNEFEKFKNQKYVNKNICLQLNHILHKQLSHKNVNNFFLTYFKFLNLSK